MQQRHKSDYRFRERDLRLPIDGSAKKWNESSVITFNVTDVAFHYKFYFIVIQC